LHSLSVYFPSIDHWYGNRGKAQQKGRRMERDATDAYDLSSFSGANKSERRGLMILISRLTA